MLPRETAAASVRAPARRMAARSAVLRWAPVLGLAAFMVLAFSMGWHKYLSFKTIGLNYHALKGFIDASLALSLLAFVAIYTAVAALSLPGATLMTLTGGLLFGWKLGSAANVVGATAGATVLFLIVKTSLGASLAGRAGPFVAKLRDGFQENAWSYMFFLRLVPVFPFFIVNLVPALLGVPFVTFVVATALGIIPGTVAYSLAGAGLGSIIDAQNASYHSCLARHPAHACAYAIDFKSLVTPELIYAAIALGLVSLIPIVHKAWSKRHAAA